MAAIGHHTGAHKKFERVQHTEIYLLGPKVHYKHAWTFVRPAP